MRKIIALLVSVVFLFNCTSFTVDAERTDVQKVLVTYTFKWNDTPVNLKTDCCAVLFDGAKLENVRSAYYQYTS